MRSDLEKKYKKFRRPAKPEKCVHCGSRRMVPRGEVWGCFECGRWDGLDGSSAANVRSPFDGWSSDPTRRS